MGRHSFYINVKEIISNVSKPHLSRITKDAISRHNWHFTKVTDILINASIRLWFIMTTFHQSSPNCSNPSREKKKSLPFDHYPQCVRDSRQLDFI